jgi:hypothetical protein
LADVRLWKGAKIRSLLAAFTPDGMTDTALLLREDLPPFFHIPREEIVPLSFGSRPLSKSNEGSREKEQDDKKNNDQPFHLSIPFYFSPHATSSAKEEGKGGQRL